MSKSIVLMIIMVLGTVAPLYAQKPVPPEQLTKVFAEVVELEDAVLAAKWAQAQKIIEEVEELLLGIGPSIRKATSDAAYQVLESSVVQLQKAVEQQDRGLALERMVPLEKELLSTMKAYHYSIHPVLMVIEGYVAEAIEAAEKQDFERVIHEMKETATIITTSADIMAEKGVGKGMQQDFREQLFAVMNAATANNQQQALQALKKMQITAGAFVWMGSQQ